VVIAIGFLSALGIDISSVWSNPAVLSSINWEEVVTLDIIWPHILQPLLEVLSCSSYSLLLQVFS